MLSNDYNGSICEVKGLNNSLLATGSIRVISDEMLEVQDSGGHLPVLAMDSKVKLIVHHTKKGVQVLAGRVYISNEKALRLKDLQSYAEYEKRRFFRQTIDHSATLLLPAGMPDANGEPLPAKLPVRVKDVSLCGLLFESDRPFSIGDEMRISMTMTHNELETLTIAVRREVPAQGTKKAYGCEVLDLSNRVEQRLNAFVLEQQQRQIRRSRR